MSEKKKRSFWDVAPQFNPAFGIILQNLGYGTLGQTVRHNATPEYFIWQGYAVSEMYFQDLYYRKLVMHKPSDSRTPPSISPAISRVHRRFLNDLFREGPDAVIETSKISMPDLAERVQRYHISNGSTDGRKIHRISSKSMPATGTNF